MSPDRRQCLAQHVERGAGRHADPRRLGAARGKAMAIATDMTIGKKNDQNSASGSRTNSRRRASVSSMSGWMRVRPRAALLVTNVRPVSDMKHVLERALVHDDFGAAESGHRAFGVSSAMIFP
jgi:hypothetical protein